VSRIRRFLEERRGVTVTLLMIPDASRKTRTWKLSLLGLYGLAALVLLLIVCAVVAFAWAGASTISLVQQRETLNVLAEEKDRLEAIAIEQQARLVEMARETAELAQRIANLEDVANQILDIVPDDILAETLNPDLLGARVPGRPEEQQEEDSATAASTAFRDASFKNADGDDGEGDSLELTGMGGAETSPAELRDWMQERLDNLKSVVDQQNRLLLQLKSSAEIYEHRLRHTPNVWPVMGRITSEYGSRKHPISGRNHVHQGIDIAVPTGTPVKATADGRVVHAGPDGGYGLVVVIDHGYGHRTLYAHNSKVLVGPGDVVRRGDTIALAGSTGVSTGPHVHYEVHVDGEPVNPRAYLPR